MNDSEKIKMLKEILKDKDVMSKDILKEKPVEGELVVAAEGDSPEEAKETILKGLSKVKLPDESKMEGMMPEVENEEEDSAEGGMEEGCSCGDPECEGECDMDESSMGSEDKNILEMLPEKSRMQFKKRLMEKIKSL